LLPQLEALYKKWHQDGLEIVGINFDQKADTGREVCKSLGLSYPQVWVPGDEKTRDLWAKATGIGVPRTFLIDREGILRADNTEKLEEEIGKLLADSAKKPRQSPRP
jgi:alkyl hydroperoxide reductase subunit AhpC